MPHEPDSCLAVIRRARSTVVEAGHDVILRCTAMYPSINRRMVSSMKQKRSFSLLVICLMLGVGSSFVFRSSMRYRHGSIRA